MIEFPENPELWELFSYVNPITGCQFVTYQYCGVAGWAFISNE